MIIYWENSHFNSHLMNRKINEKKTKKTVTRLFFEDNENLQQSQNEVWHSCSHFEVTK